MVELSAAAVEVKVDALFSEIGGNQINLSVAVDIRGADQAPVAGHGAKAGGKGKVAIALCDLGRHGVTGRDDVEIVTRADDIGHRDAGDVGILQDEREGKLRDVPKVAAARPVTTKRLLSLE
jgi:hypothetical protein